MSILQKHRRAGAEKHHEINGNVLLDALRAELPLVRQHHGPLDVVVGVGDELVQGLVARIVLARLHLHGHSREPVVVVNQKVHLALALVVIIIKVIAVRQHTDDDVVLEGVLSVKAP